MEVLLLRWFKHLILVPLSGYMQTQNTLEGLFIQKELEDMAGEKDI